MKDRILGRLESEHYEMPVATASGKHAAFRQHIGKHLRHMKELKARGEEHFEVQERAGLAAEAAARALRRHEHDYANLLKVHSRSHFHSVMSGSPGKRDIELRNSFRQLSQLLIQQAYAAEAIAAKVKEGNLIQAMPAYRELMEAARQEQELAEKTGVTSSLLTEHEQSLSRAMAAASSPFSPPHIP